jgi:hypothetical protein
MQQRRILRVDLLVGDDAAGQNGCGHRHVVGGLAELGLIVRLAGHTGVDCGEQRVDVGTQFLSDRIRG